MAHNSVGFSDPLTLELDVIGPKANPTRGEPVESAKVLFEDAHSQSGVWECTPGAFAGRRDGYRETFTIIAGGGVRTFADVREYGWAGANAVSLGSEAWLKPLWSMPFAPFHALHIRRLVGQVANWEPRA